MQYKFYLNDVEIDEPIGWDSAELTINKDFKTFGLNYSYVSELEFINNGYSILRNAYETLGIEAIVYLEIFMQCQEDAEFEQIFKGKANFTSYKRKISDLCSIVVNFEEENNSILISQNIDKKFLIGTDKTITLHPKYILDKTTYNNPSFILQTERIPQTFIDGGVIEGFLSVNVPYFDNPNNSANLPTDDYKPFNDCSGIEDLFNFKTSFPTNANVKGKMKGTYSIKIGGSAGTNSAKIIASLRYGNSSACTGINLGTIMPIVNNITPISITFTGSFDISFDEDIFLNTDDGICVGYGILGLDIYFTNADFSCQISDFNYTVTTETAGTDTLCKVVTVNEAFEQVCDNLLGSGNYQSDFFTNEKVALTNGFKIRQFEKPFYLSFQDLLNGLFPIYCIGYGFVNGKLRVEPLEFFFENNLSILTFNEVFELTETTKNDLIYNTLKTGYEKWGTEQGTTKNNTLDAFCTPHNYNTTITQYKNEFKAVSQFIGDAYAIEYTRRQQYLTTPTNEWIFDNDTFVICLNEAETGAEKNENIISSSNVLSPETQYNFRISSARNLLRLNKIFSIGYAKNDLGFANFSGAEANFIMKTKYNGSYNNKDLVENINLQWNDSYNEENKPLFDALTVEFEYPLSFTAYNTIKANPNKTYQISRIGAIVFAGYLISLNYKPNEGLANFVFIAKNSGSDAGCVVDYVEVDYVECDYVE